MSEKSGTDIIKDPKQRTRYATRVGVFGIVSNLLLGVMKIVIGLMTGSIGIIADAANNISDCASSGLTIVGFTLAEKKPDREHPYGHARYEYLFGFTIGIVMLLTGAMFAKESIQKIINPQVLSITVPTYLTLGLAILVKLLQMLLYLKVERTIGSPALRASAADSRNDMITTGGILVAMVVMAITGINIDGLVGLAVSIFVIISSIQTIKDQVAPLIGIKPTRERVKMISDKILSYPGVLGIHDLVLHNYGVHNDFVTVHVEVDSSRSIVDIHDTVDRIEMDFKEEMGISITIHMDPVEVGNQKLDEIKALIGEALGRLDSELSFHDVRMVDGKDLTKVIFDCVVPPDKHYDSDMLASYLKQEIRYSCTLDYVVEIDIPFC
ncbi:MAG: cation transporter [Spirochaetales bacterium]|nr:cation transporter [Spirochaetales bacterium]